MTSDDLIPEDDLKMLMLSAYLFHEKIGDMSGSVLFISPKVKQSIECWRKCKRGKHSMRFFIRWFVNAKECRFYFGFARLGMARRLRREGLYSDSRYQRISLHGLWERGYRWL